MECDTYKQNYTEAVAEIALLKVEKENAIAKLDQFRQSIGAKLADVLLSEELVDAIVL